MNDTSNLQHNDETLRKKLAGLDLSKKMVAGVMVIFDTYLCSIEAYSKPAGIMEFNDNLTEIESLSKKLYKKLKNITSFERQMLMQHGQENIRETTSQIADLSIACASAKKIKYRFSRREPFLSQLTLELWEFLERNGIAVTVYKNNILCHIINILLNEQPKSDRGLNLLRDISNRFKKKAKKNL